MDQEDGYAVAHRVGQADALGDEGEAAGVVDRTSFVYSRATNEVTKLLTNPTIQNMMGYNSQNATSQGGFAKEGYPIFYFLVNEIFF